MGIVTKFGLWLDKRFPQKISADEVNEKIKRFDAEITVIHQGMEAFEMRLSAEQHLIADVDKLKREVQNLQALSVIKSKTPAYGGNMNQNWPLPPVLPGK